MHGDKLGSPVLSTYSIGGATTPPRRGSGLALPVIVILGTASVAAVVSYSFDGDTPAVSDQRAEAPDQAPFALEQVDPVGPGFSADPGDALATADEAGPAPAEDGSRAGLPYLGVLQPGTAERAMRPASGTRVHLASRRADRPEIPSVEAPASPAECVLGCDEASVFAVPAASNVAAPDAGQSQTVVPLAAEDPASLADLPDAAGPGAPADVALADSAAADTLQTDTPGVTLVEPAGELVAVAPVLGPGQADATPVLAEPAADLAAPTPGLGVVEPAPTDAPPVEVSVAAATPRPVEVAPAMQGQPEPVGDTPAEAGDSGAETTIPQHLARIGERYAGPAAEPPAPAAIAREDSPPAVSPVPGSTVAVSLGDGVGSTVIVHEDELVAIRLSELVGLLEDRFDHPLYVWIKSSAAASKFVTAETLAAAGIRARYDPQRNQVILSTTDD